MGATAVAGTVRGFRVISIDQGGEYSATGGTGGLSSSVHRKTKMQTRVLGDYQAQLVHKAFLDF